MSVNCQLSKSCRDGMHFMSVIVAICIAGDFHIFRIVEHDTKISLHNNTMFYVTMLSCTNI